MCSQRESVRPWRDGIREIVILWFGVLPPMKDEGNPPPLSKKGGNPSSKWHCNLHHKMKSLWAQLPRDQSKSGTGETVKEDRQNLNISNLINSLSKSILLFLDWLLVGAGVALRKLHLFSPSLIYVRDAGRHDADFYIVWLLYNMNVAQWETHSLMLR